MFLFFPRLKSQWTKLSSSLAPFFKWPVRHNRGRPLESKTDYFNSFLRSGLATSLLLVPWSKWSLAYKPPLYSWVQPSLHKVQTEIITHGDTLTCLLLCCHLCWRYVFSQAANLSCQQDSTKLFAVLPSFRQIRGEHYFIIFCIRFLYSNSSFFFFNEILIA